MVVEADVLIGEIGKSRLLFLSKKNNCYHGPLILLKVLLLHQCLKKQFGYNGLSPDILAPFYAYYVSLVLIIQHPYLLLLKMIQRAIIVE